MQAVALNSQIPNLHAKHPRRTYTRLLSTCNPVSFSHASLMHHTMQKGMHCRKTEGAPDPSRAARYPSGMPLTYREEPSQVLVIVLYFDMLQTCLNIPEF